MKPLRWAEPESFQSIEQYRLHVVEYYSEISDDAAFLRPAVQILRSWYGDGKHYHPSLIKACERVVRDYVKTLPEFDGIE